MGLSRLYGRNGEKRAKVSGRSIEDQAVSSKNSSHTVERPLLYPEKMSLKRLKVRSVLGVWFEVLCHGTGGLVVCCLA